MLASGRPLVVAWFVVFIELATCSTYREIGYTEYTFLRTYYGINSEFSGDFEQHFERCTSASQIQSRLDVPSKAWNSLGLCHIYLIQRYVGFTNIRAIYTWKSGNLI